MSLPTLYEICTPREDVLHGTIAEADFAADLAQVLKGEAPDEYKDPSKFFANTHPTRGLKDLLWNVCQRLNGSSSQVASIFRLDTNYGGGKTHSLIALSHAAKGMQGVKNIEEFIEPLVLPKNSVRIAAFDGENADPANGRALGDGLRAYTPWGELAYALAGKNGYELVRRSDEQGTAPGAETLKELFDDTPALILIDELSVYLRKLGAKDAPKAGRQLTAFLTSLFKAVESSPCTALVYTLAIGKDKTAIDAYSEENQFLIDSMAEMESVSARKATILDPTGEDETVKVLRRRLFSYIDDARASSIIDAYAKIWNEQREHLPPFGLHDTRLESFKAGFPLHPELIETLKEKTSTLSNFQRVRGMLRILARTVSLLWTNKPLDAYAVHLHHIDPTFEPIRQEIVTKLGQSSFVPALKADIAAVFGDQPSLAQELDATQYAGLPPYGSYVARTIFYHTLAFNESLKGLSSQELRYAIVSPSTDISFVDDATRRFVQTSAYLDDRPNVPLRYLTEANLTQMIRRQEKQVDPAEVRALLNDKIKVIFSGNTFISLPFPSMPNEVPDDSGEGKPTLVIINYDAADVTGDQLKLPALVSRIFREKGSSGELRVNRNNLAFIVADMHKKDEMKRKMARRLALEDLRRPERLADLADHQRNRLMELYQKSEQELAVSIQQAYRHTFYPSRNRMDEADMDIAHTAIEIQNASASPGDGQRQVVRVLREIKKLRLPEDYPDSAIFIRDRTPLKKGQITTLDLRAEFRRDTALPMLVGDDVFTKGIRQGIEQGEFVYKSGELICGKGDPWAEIKIDSQSFIYTTSYAREHAIWPPVSLKSVPLVSAPVPPGTMGHPGEWGTYSGERLDSDNVQEPAPAYGPSPTLIAEGVMTEALTCIWEDARARKFTHITTLDFKIFDTTDAFKLMGPVGTVPNCEKQITIEGDYATMAASELHFDFKGTIEDAKPVKDFLEPQLRAASEKDVNVTYHMNFSTGLSLDGKEPEALADRLTRFGTGVVYVTAVAERQK